MAGEAASGLRMLGCLLGGALGDALGAPIEFDDIDAIRRRHGPDGLTRPVPAFGRLGAITDDTQMTLFTLEGLIRASFRARSAGDGTVAGMVHRAYLRWLHTQGEDRVPGEVLTGWLITEPDLFHSRAPGLTCLTALRATMTGELGTPEHRLNDSKGCGGVMRVAPVAFLPVTPEQAFRHGVEAAALTHSHPSGYLSAGAFAALLRLLADGLDLPAAIAGARALLLTWPGHEEQLHLLDEAVTLAGQGRPAPELIARRLGGGWVGEEALAIAVCAALLAEDTADGLRLAVNHSGDSDSTGAICGNILGLRDGAGALPSAWLADLELRGVMEALVRDARAEFTGAVRGERAWRLRYPPS